MQGYYRRRHRRQARQQPLPIPERPAPGLHAQAGSQQRQVRPLAQEGGPGQEPSPHDCVYRRRRLLQ